MTAARTPEGEHGLAALREHPGGAVIGLDYDGTLAPIVDDPARAFAHPAAAVALRGLLPLAGAVVIITGRPARLAVELGGFGDLDGLVVLGQYGMERWESGRLTAPPIPPGVAEARMRLPEVVAGTGAWIEDKGRALAVHTRRTAEPQATLDQLRGPIEALAAEAGLVVEPGRLVLELRPPGMGKGAALREFVAERGTVSSVLFTGDDLGDLPAYDALEELRGQGIPGVKVCSRSAEVTALEERADVIVDGPDGVVRLLRSLMRKS